MLLGRKHANQQTVVRADFSGGLNSTATYEGIAENQLAEVVNMEVDHSTGRLKTVAGTIDLTKTANIMALLHDGINRKFLLVKTDKRVYPLAYDGTLGASLGTLTGNLYPIGAAWEDGLLIASGGKLQYYNGTGLVTLDGSPANSLTVYVRSGRILVSDSTTMHYSGVGDETTWTTNDNDSASAQWIDPGYKDGGYFLGMVSLSNDVLVIKDNRRLYRVYNEYPNWTVGEVSRNVECSGRLSYCAVADSVFILGQNQVQLIQTSDMYGDMKPSNVATLVQKEITALPENAKVRYVPPMSQVWFIGGREVMMYDLATGAWYKRQFNSPVLDVVSVGDEVFVVKADRVSVIDDNTFYDAGEPLSWRFRAQRLISQHDFLLKRTQVSIVPYSPNLYNGEIRCGAIIVDLPIPSRAFYIYRNLTPIYKNKVKIAMDARAKGVYLPSDWVYENPELIYQSPRYIWERQSIIKESTNVFRSKHLDLTGFGARGGFVLNGIMLDIAEV